MIQNCCKMTNDFKEFCLFFSVLIFTMSCVYEKPEVIKIAEADLPDKLDYNFHVRPILSDKCLACHGPDAANQKAGLRLD